MKLIVITSEIEIAGETDAVNSLFEAGLELLHLRKPTFSEVQLTNWMTEINPLFKDRIVWHDYFNGAKKWGVKRLHLNRRNPIAPEGNDWILSRSYHHISELEEACFNHSYVFLSPLFDSISKNGYQSNFGENELIEASAQNLINNKVMALGGITPEKIALLKKYGFGGVAVLGYIWEEFSADPDIKKLMERFNLLQKITQQ